MTIKNISITGAAGNIAYSLIFRILSNLPFRHTNKVNLNITESQSGYHYYRGLSPLFCAARDNEIELIQLLIQNNVCLYIYDLCTEISYTKYIG